ncbi:MAG: peptidase S41 [Sphingomonadales bacterium]|nr:peptidase S41 [Sphingomonadales bacterium]MBD3773503.1 peptidase S41 [Paracoccaceae bacterium]
MQVARTTLTLLLAASLSACGGGGSSPPPTSGTPAPSPTPTPTPTPTTSACSLSARQDWVKSVIDEWYLFPAGIDNTVNKAAYTDLQSYIDALVAPSVAPTGGPLQHAGLTYITSIAAENAYYNSGSSAGFGVRLAYDTTNNRVFVVEAFEGAPALAANIDRGTEILSIGTSAGTAQTVSSLMASGGPQAVVDALGPSTAGTTRYLQVRSAAGSTFGVSVAKTDYTLDPVSDRYGAKIIDDNGKKVGYINLRTFIDTADPDLNAAFANFRAQGVTQLIIDLRYNGGGLVNIAELMGDLMGRDKVGQVFSRTTLRPSKASYNETSYFTTNANSITPMKIAFIGRGGTASASELIMNSMIPYLGSNVALVGTNTYGKPVGQFGFDKSECDDRLRVIAFRTENRDGGADYYSGLAGVMPNTCKADDDIFHQFGDPAETSISVALDFLAGRACTPITGGGQTTQSVRATRELLQPPRPDTAQRETPGLF